jgi:hypothetical protein
VSPPTASNMTNFVLYATSGSITTLQLEFIVDQHMRNALFKIDRRQNDITTQLRVPVERGSPIMMSRISCSAKIRERQSRITCLLV